MESGGVPYSDGAGFSEPGTFAASELPTWGVGKYGRELVWPSVGTDGSLHSVIWDRGAGQSPLTFACVVRLDSVSDHVLVSNECDYGLNNNKGIFLQAPSSGGWRITLGGVADGTLISTPAQNTTDYFFVAASYDRVRLKCFVKNLTTGVIGTADDAQTGAGANSAGHWGFGRWGKDVALGLEGAMVVGVISEVSPVFNLEEFRRWSEDPLGFLHPYSRVIAKVAAVGGANPHGPLGHPLHGPLAGPIAA